ncbi:MAG TPA: DUF4388 domain-containing protein, partial [Myxococcaceae bacterium]|nr:DUF4388 domain-containing protein [Myxococcaceae bacterium]
SDALSKRGFSVAVERKGEWAVETFAKRPFDAVIAEVTLPDLDGYEVLRRIRELPRGLETPVILTSASALEPSDVRAAVEARGAFALLEKPIKMRDLAAQLHRALGERYPAPPPLAEASRVEEITVPERLADRQAEDEVTRVEEASAALGTRAALRGDFRETPFPRALAEIYRWKASGALLLRRDRIKKIIYFQEGFPQLVKSNLLSECLGRVMVKERMISEAECDESLRRMKGSGRQQGTTLVEMGCINPHNLAYALNLQLRTKLFEVFAWTEGQYQFNPSVSPPAEPVQLDLSTAAILYEGIRRAYGPERLRSELASVTGAAGGPRGDVESLYVHPASLPLYALQDAGLGEEEEQILSSCDGHMTVATVRALAILPPLETDRLLYAMVCAGRIELRPEPAAQIERRERPAPPPADPAFIPPPLPPPPRRATATAIPRAALERRPKETGVAHERHATVEAPAWKGEPQMLSQEEALIRERLISQVDRMRHMSYFEVLGVGVDAPRDEVQRRYFALAKEYHPDRHFGAASAETRQLAAQIYDLISAAHDTLMNAESRARYQDELSRGVRRG